MQAESDGIAEAVGKLKKLLGGKKNNFYDNNSIKALQEKLRSDCEVLKSKLIDAGIQGKLTEQLSEDGTAEELYVEAHANSIADEEKILDIPDTWSWIRLGWAMEIERGGSPRPIKTFLTDSDYGINWIKIGDVEKDGKYIIQTKEKIKPEGEKKSRKVYPGDFLLTNSMSFGRPYISKIEGCIHDGWLLLRNSKQLFDLDYLYWLLSSRYVYNQFLQKASGATVDNLNKEKVASAVIPLPPLEEQKRIANKLEKISSFIERI
jgi:type I restriction enzyme S subunit